MHVSLFDFRQDVELLLDAGDQRPVEGLDDTGLGALDEERRAQAARMLNTGLVVCIVVLDAAARIDDALQDHRQD